jgi:enoyl-CoA hydratase
MRGSGRPFIGRYLDTGRGRLFGRLAEGEQMTTEFGPIRVEVSDYIATVTIDRPPVNAVDREALQGIRDAFTSLDDRRDVRVAIFTGAGSRAFMGGADLNTVGTRPQGDDVPLMYVTDPGRVARDAMWAVTDCAVPVIGAINGPAIGAGLAFAACCDILVAAEHASFGTLEINVGLLGASAHVSLLVGRHKAREMFFLGEKIPAAELVRLGAVRVAVPADQLTATAVELARQLASKSPIALRLAKEAMNRVEGVPLRDAYRTEQDYTARLIGFEDSAEARQAYLEKRDPNWQWR